MFIYLLFVLVISIIYLAYQAGYYRKYLDFCIKIKNLIVLLNNINYNELIKKEKIDSFIIADNDKSAIINYKYYGQQYKILIPYNRSKIALMTQLKVELINENNISTDIMQQPGIPYLFTAKDLGGINIKITNSETGKSYTYDENKQPLYADEVMDDE